MNANDFLPNIHVASPCSARWQDMTGDERARFCGQCRKHVYDLSQMTTESAAELIREKEGKLCVRFYRRADGTILTADCPVGVAAIMLRLKRLVAIGIGVIIPACAVSASVNSSGQPGHARNRLYQTWDKSLLAIKNWIQPSPPGPAPSGFIMGDVCLPVPPTNATSLPSPTRAN